MEALALFLYGWAAVAVFFALLLHPVGRHHGAKAAVLAALWPISIFGLAGLLIANMREAARHQAEDNLP